MNKTEISIVILTYNGIKDHLENTLRAVFSQEFKDDFEVIAIDSASTDETISLLKKYPNIRIKEIKKTEFGHGKTRRLGAELAEGELVVFLTQDATPANKNWLKNITKNFKDPRVVGVCSRVLPRKAACLLKKIEVDNDLSGRKEKISAEIKNQEEFNKLTFYEKRLNYYFFNDVSSCVRKNYLLSKPVIDVEFAEDVEFAKMALDDGKKIIFEPKSKVFHSHDYSLLKTYRRNLIDSEYHTKFLGIKNVPTLKHALQNTIHQVQRDFSQINSYRPNTFEKMEAVLYSPIIHFAEQFGQYKGTK